MARTVDPRSVWGAKTGAGEKHDWLRWCDGRTHVLTRGEDFSADLLMSSTRSAFRQFAKRNGFDTTKVKTSVPDDDTVIIYVVHTPQNRRAFLELAGKAAADDPGYRARFEEYGRAAEAEGDRQAAQAWHEAFSATHSAADPVPGVLTLGSAESGSDLAGAGSNGHVR